MENEQRKERSKLQFCVVVARYRTLKQTQLRETESFPQKTHCLVFFEPVHLIRLRVEAQERELKKAGSEAARSKHEAHVLREQLEVLGKRRT